MQALNACRENTRRPFAGQSRGKLIGPRLTIASHLLHSSLVACDIPLVRLSFSRHGSLQVVIHTQQWQHQQQCPATLAFPCPTALRGQQDHTAQPHPVPPLEAVLEDPLQRVWVRQVTMRATRVSKMTRFQADAPQIRKTFPRSKTGSASSCRNTLRTSSKGSVLPILTSPSWKMTITSS